MEKDLFERLLEAPDAVLVMERFQTYLKSEKSKKQAFYDLVHENMKAEFINGEIVMHSPVRMRHLVLSSNLSFELLAYVKQNDLGFVGIEKMMIELSRNCYEPDIVYYRKEVAATFTDSQKIFPAPDLVVEILSESTEEKDYGIKFRDYEAHGVGEYWIVDADKRKLEQYLLLEGKFYLHNSLGETGRLISIVVPGFEVQLTKVWA